jgi:hypothetical protein
MAAIYGAGIPLVLLNKELIVVRIENPTTYYNMHWSVKL